MAKKIMGNVLLKIDGQLVKTIPGSVEIEFGGFEREEVMADGQFHYRETPIASRVTAKLAVTEKTDIRKINNLAEGMVEVVTDIGGGLTWTQSSATRMGEPVKASSSDGQMDFMSAGDPIET